MYYLQRTRNSRLLDIILAIALAFFLFLFLRQVGHMILASRAETRTTASTARAYAPAEKPATTPSRLIIPRIGVSALVQSVGLNSKGQIGIPSGENQYQDVAWFNQSVFPGQVGSAVIDGHVDTRFFSAGVFRNLHKLAVGDMVQVVDAHGSTFSFKVVGTAKVPANADTSAILSPSTTARLNLVTCTGDWDSDARGYDERLVVYTELIK